MKSIFLIIFFVPIFLQAFDQRAFTEEVMLSASMDELIQLQSMVEDAIRNADISEDEREILLSEYKELAKINGDDAIGIQQQVREIINEVNHQVGNRLAAIAVSVGIEGTPASLRLGPFGKIGGGYDYSTGEVCGLMYRKHEDGFDSLRCSRYDSYGPHAALMKPHVSLWNRERMQPYLSIKLFFPSEDLSDFNDLNTWYFGLGLQKVGKWRIPAKYPTKSVQVFGHWEIDHAHHSPENIEHESGMGNRLRSIGRSIKYFKDFVVAESPPDIVMVHYQPDLSLRKKKTKINAFLNDRLIQGEYLRFQTREDNHGQGKILFEF
tara:strand:+ start:10044 stop:11009 length:966 start_codon:yes stop_codon:yes gene_type:complete